MRHRAVRIAARSSLAALACALGTAVWGQAFQGTPQLQSGAATFARATPGAETITVDTAQAVVNWTVTAAPDAGGNIDYLPQGAAATFTAGANVTGFTILNRILPADPASRVAFNGQVTSNVAAVPGGNVWFYSPGGIIVGDTGRFDVGSLLLTTLDPVRDANGAFIDGAGRTVFGPGATGGIVNILSGARIDAAPGSPATGSYVALLAPIVYQAGTVTVNGSAAYVAAEAATLTIGQGLFDIVVTTGSTDNGFPLQHAGTTTGPASTGAGDAQRIYLVSVPKNDAITLAIAPTAQLGFTPATAAGVENGRIVLSAGSNVTAGAPDPLGQASPLSASIRIDGGVFSSPVIGQANTNILAASTTGTPSFAGDLTLAAGNRLTDEQSVVQVAARVNGQTLSVGGTLSLTAQRSDNATADGTGGVASLLAENGGVIRIAGSATIDATGSAGTVTSGGTVLRAGLARGGNAGILARSGGLVDVGGSTRIVADALAIAGNGTVQGGSAAINAIGPGRVSLGDSVSVSAGVRQSDVAINAVTAAGGQAIVNADAGGQVTITGALRVDSGVAAGFSRTFGLAGPTARGGASFVSATGAGSLVTVNGGVTLDSSATRLDDNNTGLGGASFGGRVSVSQSDSGRVVIVGGADLAADATGGNSARADTAAGAGTGGDARFVANAGAIEADAVTLTANGLGGQNQSAGDGGAGTGGLVNIGAGTGSALVRGAALLSANGTGGLTANGGATAGAGRGGQALVGTVGSGTITIGGLTASAAGIGGRQAGTAVGGTSGAGFGGTAEVFVSPAAAGGGAGTVRLASMSLDATGRGGVITSVAGGTGGAGSGGQARVQAGAGGLVEVAGAGELFADGFGGTGFLTNGVTTADRGGTGVGGLAILRTDGGTIELRGDALLEANGFGGFAATGGDGFGGSNGDLSQGAYINALGGRIAVAGRTELTVLGSGGTSNAGAGGDGTGGTANISAQTVTTNAGGSTIALGEILIDVTGDGGAGGAGANGGAGAAGGTGLGGNSTIIGNAGNGVLSAAALTVSVAGQGGRGGDGATGGAGGAGTGGFVQLGTASGPALPVYVGRAAFAGVTAIATGQGGDGGTSASGAAAAGGAGIGGTATVIVRGSLVETGDGTFFANGIGGAGGTIGGAVAGVGGQGVGGDATILVTPHATSGAPATGRFGAIVQSVDAVNGAGAGGAAPAFGTGGIVVTGSSATLAALTVSAGGAVQRTSTAFAASTAPGNVGGQVQVTGFDDRGSGIEATNATLAIAGDATLFTGGDVDLFADASSVTIGGRLASPQRTSRPGRRPPPRCPPIRRRAPSSASCPAMRSPFRRSPASSGRARSRSPPRGRSRSRPAWPGPAGSPPLRAAARRSARWRAGRISASARARSPPAPSSRGAMPS